MTCISHPLSAASPDTPVSAALRSVGPSRTAAQDKPPQGWPRPALSRVEGSQALHPPPSPALRHDSGREMQVISMDAAPEPRTAALVSQVSTASTLLHTLGGCPA
jgi:hypothetical protein